MIVRIPHRRQRLRAAAAAALLALGVGLCGCANMGDTMVSAFADPAKYEFFDCKQLEAERKSLATRGADLQRLMAKAETGVAGSVVSELAYRNDYIAVRGQAKFADEAWQRNKCVASIQARPDIPSGPATSSAPPAGGKGEQPPARSRSSVY
jgi:hypothetical protein